MNGKSHVIEVYPNGTGEEELMAKSGRSERNVRYRQGEKEPLELDSGAALVIGRSTCSVVCEHSDVVIPASPVNF